jgi:hypothetical protein
VTQSRARVSFQKKVNPHGQRAKADFQRVSAEGMFWGGKMKTHLRIKTNTRFGRLRYASRMNKEAFATAIAFRGPPGGRFNQSLLQKTGESPRQPKQNKETLSTATTAGGKRLFVLPFKKRGNQGFSCSSRRAAAGSLTRR